MATDQRWMFGHALNVENPQVGTFPRSTLYAKLTLVEAQDNATVAALAMLAGASGALAKTKATVLLTVDEAQEAMRKAGGATFRPPS